MKQTGRWQRKPTPFELGIHVPIGKHQEHRSAATVLKAMPQNDTKLPVLTKRQKQIYEFLKDKIFNRGYGPTVLEIGSEFNIRSPNAVMCHLKALEKKGLITRGPQSSRTVRLTSEGGAEPTESWTEAKNARRCDLIDKKIQETISDAELLELEKLQEHLRRHLDRVAPYPIEGARKLHKQLLEKKHAQEHTS
jgi:DNA-binding MarR family transcriptional regulator